MKILHLSLLISFLFSLSLSKELCNPQDKKVLLQIKKYYGSQYLLTSWSSDTDCCTTWNNVECDETTNRIVSLTIVSGELSGQIPAEVGDLPYLKRLRIHKLTNITGPIPPSIAKLTRLTFLDLSWLNISGPIPDFFSGFKDLIILDLSFNSLSGSIPSSLSLLPNVDGIRLDRNMLTGPIPESFGKFIGKVPEIWLSHNQLSGKIPASLGSVNFWRIDFSRNKLEGDASMFLGPNKTTQIVDLSRNLLEFDLSKVVFPNTLEYLDINHNKIFGSIPTQMTQLVDLRFLNVSYNRLCGQIPEGGKLQSFDSSAYFHNRCLCGTPLLSCK